MNARDVEDLIISLFDPQLTVAEKIQQVQENPVVSCCSCDNAGALCGYGAVVNFSCGDTFLLHIIPIDQDRG
jgi:hypothetical protein